MPLNGFEQISLLDCIDVLTKISAVLILVIVAQGFVQFGSADRRALVARISLIYLCLAPFAIAQNWQILPQLKVHAPLAWSALSDAALDIPNLPLLAYSASNHAASNSHFAIHNVFFFCYITVSLLLLLGLSISIRNLSKLHDSTLGMLPQGCSQTKYVEWSHRLKELQVQYGICNTVALVISNQIQSPISWGIWRHTIIIDQDSFTQHSPDDILRHELAHILNNDWITVIGARVVCALYWFHPMIWILHQQFRYQIECAADDTVLRMGGKASEYAQTLINVSQSHEKQKHMAMGLAARGTSLYRRIMNILSTDRERTAVTRRDWNFGVIASLILLCATASISLVGEQVQWPQQLFQQVLFQERSTIQIADQAADQLEQLQNPNFSVLAKALRERQFEQRHAIEPASFKQRKAIPALILALHDADPTVRRLALWGLSEMRFFETIPVMAAMLKDTDPMVRGDAARAIGDCGEPAWANALLGLLSDVSPYVRQQAAHALGDLAVPAHLSVLKSHLQDKDQAVIEEIRWAINEIEG